MQLASLAIWHTEKGFLSKCNHSLQYVHTVFIFINSEILFVFWFITNPAGFQNCFSFRKNKFQNWNDLYTRILQPSNLQSDTLVKISVHGVKNHKANGSLMVAQWGVVPSAALHPVPVWACLTDTSHTGCHCSLWVDWCSEWLMLAGSSVVLHMCCSTACPQVTFPHVCACAFVWVFKEDKDDMITTLKQWKSLIQDTGVCVKSEKETERMMWALCNSSTALPAPMFFVSSLLSHFPSYHFCHFQFLHWCYPASLFGPQAAWPAFIPSHHLHQLCKVDLGKGKILQRSFVRWLPLPPHTVLGAQCRPLPWQQRGR